MITRFAQQYNIKFPLVWPPMTGVAGGALAAAVQRGGGLGAIGVIDQEQLAREARVARKALNLTEDESLPLLLGLLCFLIESPHGSAALAEPLLRAMVSLRPKAIWLAFGERIEHHIKTIRQLETELGVERIKIIVMAGSLERVKEIVKWGEVDAIVAQGIEAGGHGLSGGGLPLFSLLPLVQQYFSTLTDSPLLLAAGGLSTAAHLLATLSFGCSGIIMGTAFLCTPEAIYPQKFKNRLLTAKGSDTVRSTVWDRVRGDLGFGAGVDGRALRNKLVTGEEGRVEDGELKSKYDEQVKRGDQGDWKAIWAGTGVGMLDETCSAEDIVQRIGLGAEKGLRELAKMSLSDKIEV